MCVHLRICMDMMFIAIYNVVRVHFKRVLSPITYGIIPTAIHVIVNMICYTMQYNYTTVT